MKPTIAVVGCGKVGSALAIQLVKAGYPIAGVASRSLTSAQSVAELISSDKFTTTPCEFTRSADVVFITTPDGQITPVCKDIAAHDGFAEGSVELHCSGAHPSTILAVAAEKGAHIGSMHPLQSFAAGPGDRNPFDGIVVSVEGASEAVEVATSMATLFGATVFPIKTEAKTLYHAAAVAASNYLVTVQSFAFKLLAAAGIAEEDAFTVLGPLIRGTVSNIEKVGVVKALTGPIARGDAATVADHIDAIDRLMPAVLDLYKTLGQHTVPVAEAAGLNPEAAAELNRLF
jgi:predicted short-subunit dehydrogenase-like oxidoreductase (DUF2520 family)